MKPVKIEQGIVSLNETKYVITASNPSLCLLFDVSYDKRGRANKELTYIYFMYDYASEYRHLNKDIRHEKASKIAGLAEDYSVSKKMQNAIDEYLEFRETTLLKAVKTLSETLQNLNMTCNDLNDIVRQKKINIETSDEDITARLSLVEKIVNVASKIPQIGEKLLALQEKAFEEVSNGFSTYGDVEIGEWEK